MKILVIEDNESVSSMIELFFLKEEIDGEFVKNGFEGFELAKQGGWDCLIIDWMLPGMDGISICQKLRQQTLLRQLLCSPQKMVNQTKCSDLKWVQMIMSRNHSVHWRLWHALKR